MYSVYCAGAFQATGDPVFSEDCSSVPSPECIELGSVTGMLQPQPTLHNYKRLVRSNNPVITSRGTVRLSESWQ